MNEKYSRNIATNIYNLKAQDIAYISIDTETYCNDNGEWQPL